MGYELKMENSNSSEADAVLPDENKIVTVTIDCGNGAADDTVYTAREESCWLPETPYRMRYILMGWCEDVDCIFGNYVKNVCTKTCLDLIYPADCRVGVLSLDSAIVLSTFVDVTVEFFRWLVRVR